MVALGCQERKERNARRPVELHGSAPVESRIRGHRMTTTLAIITVIAALGSAGVASAVYLFSMMTKGD